ncbi:MAG: type II toxin-antitoxin system VapC family toxin [Methanoregulaceae archaeon]|nr:type II toxin-antitoxin system VapC family toxin [Methanoregulaceae archaeon]
MRPKRIYLDVCCLCRPFDDQTVHRIRMETEAITEILKHCMTDWDLVGSEAIESEIFEIADEERRESVESVLQFTRNRVVIDEEVEGIARGYHRSGLDPFDALHLACAERAGAVFLTTDDALIKSIKRHEDKITTRVHNPVQWLMEVTKDGSEDIE